MRQEDKELSGCLERGKGFVKFFMKVSCKAKREGKLLLNGCLEWGRGFAKYFQNLSLGNF